MMTYWLIAMYLATLAEEGWSAWLGNERKIGRRTLPDGDNE